MSDFSGNDITSGDNVTADACTAAADRSWLKELLAQCTSLSQLQQLIKEKRVSAKWSEVREKIQQLKEIEVSKNVF